MFYHLPIVDSIKMGINSSQGVMIELVKYGRQKQAIYYIPYKDIKMQYIQLLLMYHMGIE